MEPKPVHKTLALDMFLWKGSDDATLGLRIIAWFTGIVFVGLGALMLSMERSAAGWPGIIVGLASISLGGRIFFNGCRRRKPAKASTS
jgi:hypothetical protein